MSEIKIIYLADDDEDDRYFIKEAIHAAGVNAKIVEVENGHDLLKLIREDRKTVASLILMDMNMPKMNGLETIAAIKNDSHFASVPLVMISTSSNTGLVSKAYEAGVNNFMTKPSTFEEFSQLAEQLSSLYLR